MEKSGNPPPYGWGNGHTMQPPPAAPPSYSQAVGGVGPSSPYTPQYPPSKQIFFIFFKIIKYFVLNGMVNDLKNYFGDMNNVPL